MLFLEFKYGTTRNKIYLRKVHERMIVSLIFLKNKNQIIY